MSVETLAYNLSRIHPQIKRAQWYELIAAAHSYPSYASCRTQEIVFLPCSKPTPADEGQFSQRAIQLRAEPTQALLAYQRAILDTPVEPVNLKLLSEQLEEDPENCQSGIQSALNDLADKGNGYAAYCLSLIAENLIAEHLLDSRPPDSFWLRMRISGEALTPTENVFADEYLSYHLARSEYISRLRMAGRSGIKNAIIRLINYHPNDGLFTSESIPELESLCEQHGLMEILQVCKSHEIVGGYLLELARLAEEGDIISITNLTELFLNTKPIWAETLIQFAMLLGTDITHDYAIAIGEDGNEYDEDIGGPVYSQEFEGIKVVGLSPADQLSAKGIAQKWFDDLSDHGVARFNVF